MSVEANKELVTQTWKSFVKGDLKAVFANMSDEISWVIFEVEAGKVRRVREYVDTKRVTDLRAKAGLD